MDANTFTVSNHGTGNYIPELVKWWEPYGHLIATTWDHEGKPKKPVGEKWESVPAAQEALATAPGIGRVPGPGVHIIDFDGKKDAAGSKKADSERLLAEFDAALADAGLLGRVLGGYAEWSTSQGLHIDYRVTGPYAAAPKKLAYHEDSKTAVELLTAGMQCVIGTAFSKGNPADVTPDEHEAIVAALSSLDKDRAPQAGSGTSKGSGDAYATTRDHRELADCIEKLTDETLTLTGIKKDGTTYWHREDAADYRANSVVIYASGGICIGSPTLQRALGYKGTTHSQLWAAARDGESLYEADHQSGPLFDQARERVARQQAAGEITASQEQADIELGVIPGPGAPYFVAEKIAGTILLWRDRGSWRSYTGTHWPSVDDELMRDTVWKLLAGARYEKPLPGTDGVEDAPWPVNRARVTEVLDALCAHTRRHGDDRGRFLAFRNGLLGIKTGELATHDPAALNTTVIDADYDPEATCPVWEAFLGESVETSAIPALQAYARLVLAHDTSLQKWLYLYGPPRGGKGTVIDVLSWLAGDGNTAVIDPRKLAGNFGAEGLLGRELARLDDVRAVKGDGWSALASLILEVCGGGMSHVERKHKTSLDVRLDLLGVLASNSVVLPGDVAGAVGSRFVYVELPKSHLGSEDTALGRLLREELPGIVNWALKGREVLARAGGRIPESETMRRASADSRISGSDHLAFLEDDSYVARETTGWCWSADLWRAWLAWCDENGGRAGDRKWLTRDLQAADTGVRRGNRARNGGQLDYLVHGVRVTWNGRRFGP